MKIKMDGAVIDIFSGAMVKDVLQKFSPKVLGAVQSGELKVTDQWGNQVGLEGAVSEEQELHLQNIPNVPEPTNKNQ